MNQRSFMLFIVILIMAGYLAYRYLHQFFVRKSEVAELVAQRETQADEERTRIENIIRTNVQQERDHRADEIRRLTDRTIRMETRVQELYNMLDEEDEYEPIPGAPSTSAAPSQNE